jgi:predicted enzyme related to lactoylglutathione lyase
VPNHWHVYFAVDDDAAAAKAAAEGGQMRARPNTLRDKATEGLPIELVS